MKATLTTIILGAIALMMVVSGITIFMSEAVTTYGIEGYDNGTYESYNRMAELSSKIDEFETNKSNVDQNNNQDILGALFSSTYTAAETIKGTGGVVNAVSNDAIEQLPAAEPFKDILKTGFGLMITVVFVVFLFMAFVIKNERV
jgi:hypothetical protein